MVPKKRSSKRQTLQNKYKIVKRAKDHKKKLKQGKLKKTFSGKKKRIEDSIPNAWPYKDELLKDIKLQPEEKVSIMINSLGSTPLEELYIISKRVNENLSKLKIKIIKSHVGRYATSMEMAGMSITILKLTEDLEKNLLSNSKCPFWTN